MQIDGQLMLGPATLPLPEPPRVMVNVNVVREKLGVTVALAVNLIVHCDPLAVVQPDQASNFHPRLGFANRVTDSEQPSVHW